MDNKCVGVLKVEIEIKKEHTVSQIQNGRKFGIPDLLSVNFFKTIVENMNSWIAFSSTSIYYDPVV